MRNQTKTIQSAVIAISVGEGEGGNRRLGSRDVILGFFFFFFAAPSLVCIYIYKSNDSEINIIGAADRRTEEILNVFSVSFRTISCISLGAKIQAIPRAAEKNAGLPRRDEEEMSELAAVARAPKKTRCRRRRQVKTEFLFGSNGPSAGRSCKHARARTISLWSRKENTSGPRR